MLKAIIFDFNGVILNDEPLHFRSMRDTVADIGLRINEEEYWNEYLPLDDASCLEKIGRNHSYKFSDGERQRLLELKAGYYRRLLQDQYPLFPGAADFVRSAATRYPLALASGARRDEIEGTLQATGLSRYFRVIAGAEDFALGKPHPESYLFALKRLNESLDGMNGRIQPRECLVIEDSIGGVQGARAAGMRCLAMTNTYPKERLTGADEIASSFCDVNLEKLERLWQEPI
jgi:HAD superfamily hydrolase (TIGR01509 family)